MSGDERSVSSVGRSVFIVEAVREEARKICSTIRRLDSDVALLLSRRRGKREINRVDEAAR